MYKLSISMFCDNFWNGKEDWKTILYSLSFIESVHIAILSKCLFYLPEIVISLSNGLLPEFWFEALLSFGAILLPVSETQSFWYIVTSPITFMNVVDVNVQLWK